MTTIVLCAGEASGDQLGASLIERLRAQQPQLQFVGIGGPAMRAVGMDIWFEAQELAVMGLVEVLRHLPRLLRLRADFLERIASSGARMYIGIDAPDFNLGVERRLKASGLRTVHYVSPSIWAWRQKRARKIGLSADCVLCLFPFEPALYQRYGVDARFVGHPFADEMPLQPDRAGARSALGLDPETPLLALLPGSRGSEIERLGADFLATAVRLQRERPGLRTLIVAANERIAAKLRSLRANTPQETSPGIIVGRMREVLAAADVVLAASGTATLEAALSLRPMVIAYRLSPLTYWIVKTFRILKVQNYALPNVLAGRELVPEISQKQVRAEVLAPALSRWLEQPESVLQLQQEFRQMHLRLRCDASSRAAAAVLELLP